MHILVRSAELLQSSAIFCNHLDHLDDSSCFHYLCVAKHTKGPSGHLALRVFSSKYFFAHTALNFHNFVDFPMFPLQLGILSV